MFADENSRDDLVVKALQECQVALDRGEPIDRAAMLEKYSEIRSELSSCLDGLELMRSANVFEGASAAQATAQLSPRASLGDFRIVRELGRGGMGIVYEAEQLSIGRRVALKVLPFASMLDRRQIARFQNEAKAAATIEHPHIVPVYFVGHDRGVYYYAMRLIHGKNLSEWLDELRDSGSSGPETKQDANTESTIRGSDNATSTGTITDRTGRRGSFYASVARVGVQVAEALEHAHSHGIIHRDIKPANIMIDEVGEAWVTDFGLARIESDVSMTMTGDLLGTLRYMAPEQTRTNPSAVDQRCDVYSLGATLYELLTLKPIFVGEDRRTLLRKIELHDPKAPSKLDAKIPRDLETIILKSLNKDPQDRYASAKGMADDLERFLTHKPIRARRTPFTQRVRMWTRRHPIIVAAAGMVSVFALIAAAAIGFLAANHEYSMRLQQEDAAKKIKSAYEEKMAALDRAEATAENLRKLVYVGEMRQAFDAWQHGWTHEVDSLLAQQVPQEGQTDCRGFEWNLLNQLAWRDPSIELLGHEGPVHDVAVFNGGKRLVSVGEDCTIRVWDLTNFSESSVLKDTRDPSRLLQAQASLLGNRDDGTSSIASKNHSSLFAVAVSPDGKKLATGRHVLSLWDLERQERIRDFTAFRTRIHGITFSPDGKYVAAHSADEEMKVVSLDGEISKSEWTGAGRYRISFSPDGSQLFVPYDRRSEGIRVRGIRSWNTDDWRHLTDYPLSSSARGNAVSSRSSSLFCGCFNGQVYRIDLDSGETHTFISAHRSRPNDIAISPQEAKLAVAYSDGTVGVTALPEDWNKSESLELKPKFLSIHDGPVNALQFVDERRIATAGDDGAIKISHLGNNSTKHTIRDSLYNRCRFRPKNDELILATYSGIRRIRLSSQQIIEDIDLWGSVNGIRRDFRVTALAVSLDGKLAAIGNANGELVLYDLGASRILNRIKQHDIRVSEIGDIAFSPDGKMLANGSDDHSIRLRSVPSLKESHRINTKGWGANVAFSLDGQHLAYSDSDSEIGIIEKQTGAQVAKTHVTSGLQGNALVFTNDGGAIVSAHHDSTIRIWSAGSLKLLATLNGHMKPVQSLRIHPDGRTLISTSGDKTVRLWHLPTRTSLGVLESFSDTTWDCDISSNGNRLAVATATRPNDGTCHVWSLTPRSPVGSFPKQGTQQRVD